MTISIIINEYGRRHSPYMGSLVNHLPMGQLAFYKLTKDLKELEIYSREYPGISNINPVNTEYPKRESLEECVGKRDLYETALDLVREMVEKDGLKSTVSKILNKYKLGMSSGVFHTLIRVAYGVEGYELDKDLKEELERGLAYYVTAYREATPVTRKIEGINIIDEMTSLSNNIHIKDLIADKETLGKRIKALYEDKKYLEELGFIIEGSPTDKIRALLKFLIPAYYNSGSIVALHCITGLHALVVLENYYDDFSEAIDIYTSCVITHIIAANIHNYDDKLDEDTQLSWNSLKIKASQSTDVHAVKLTYSTYKLNKLYNIPKLKDVALKRIKHR